MRVGGEGKEAPSSPTGTVPPRENIEGVQGYTKNTLLDLKEPFYPQRVFFEGCPHTKNTPLAHSIVSETMKRFLDKKKLSMHIM